MTHDPSTYSTSPHVNLSMNIAFSVLDFFLCVVTFVGGWHSLDVWEKKSIENRAQHSPLIHSRDNTTLDLTMTRQ